MQSFRTEIESPIVEKDILELNRKIQLFKEEKIDEERFRSLRLARGIYGQRQEGVQMIRIKLPYGKVTSEQLHRIADVSDEYSKGRFLVKSSATIVILMGMSKLEEIVAIFQKENKGESPVAIIQNGTTANQKTGLGTINTITEVVAHKKLSSPAIIVVGEVVKESHKLRSFFEEIDSLKQRETIDLAL